MPNLKPVLLNKKIVVPIAIALVIASSGVYALRANPAPIQKFQSRPVSSVQPSPTPSASAPTSAGGYTDTNAVAVGKALSTIASSPAVGSTNTTSQPGEQALVSQPTPTLASSYQCYVSSQLNATSSVSDIYIIGTYSDGSTQVTRGGDYGVTMTPTPQCANDQIPVNQPANN